MNPNSVKSTLSSLAFGNVIAAAACNHQKEFLTQEKTHWQQVLSTKRFIAFHVKDFELDKLQADMIAALKLLGEVTGSEHMICHFYHREFYHAKCTLFVAKLGVKTIPLVIYCSDLGGTGNFTTKTNGDSSDKERYIISEKKDNEDDDYHGSKQAKDSKIVCADSNSD
ncbi:hypothetical protein RCOM_1436320 [Ricinus communis]|uniref:Uncharacterized protein n=1 Tax=Ricinus communis TaxID=3988 RepID=B9RFP7_RICCO|nr:hypothetical protein RCOM_1436320 [Ricinus communis]